jgi:hypothetical protein
MKALKFGDRTVPAEMVHAAALAAIQGSYGKLVGVEEWLSQR